MSSTRSADHVQSKSSMFHQTQKQSYPFSSPLLQDSDVFGIKFLTSGSKSITPFFFQVFVFGNCFEENLNRGGRAMENKNVKDKDYRSSARHLSSYIHSLLNSGGLGPRSPVLFLHGGVILEEI